MADGLTTQTAALATIPDATKVATDDCGAAGHAQLMKLAVATDGNATAIPADADGLKVNLGADNDVTVTSSALPSGAATSAKQDTAQTALDAIKIATELIDDAVASEGAALGKGVLLQGDDGTDRTNVAVDTDGHVQVDVLLSALPSGAATSAKQDTIIGHLDGVEGSLADAVTALQVIDDWDETNRAKVNPIVGNAGVSAGAGTVDAGTQRATLASDDPAVARLATIDASTAAALRESVFDTKVGSLTETAPASDTASSGLNGRLQRIAQRVTSLIALLPAALVSGRLDVNLGAAPAEVTLAAGTNTNEVVGDAAHDAAAAGNPLLGGLTAQHARATAVSADGDAVRSVGDRYGRSATIGVELSRAAAQATASGNTELVAAPSAGSKLRLKRVELSNSHASIALTVGVRFGAAGTIFSKAYLPAAGGAKVINIGLDYTLGGDAEALNVNLSGTGQIECSAFYETVAT